MKFNLITNPIFFYGATFTLSYFALGVLFSKKPIKALLNLMVLMLSVGLFFVVLGAYYLGAVQFTVYAGAILVLNVLALMRGEIDQDVDQFESDKPTIGKFIKVGSVGVLLGSVMGALSLKRYSYLFVEPESVTTITKKIFYLFFENHIYLFEFTALFLLTVIIGVVSIGKFKLEQENK